MPTPEASESRSHALRHICRTEAAEKLETALQTCQATITGDNTGLTTEAYVDELMKLL